MASLNNLNQPSSSNMVQGTLSIDSAMMARVLRCSNTYGGRPVFREEELGVQTRRLVSAAVAFEIAFVTVQ